MMEFWKKNSEHFLNKTWDEVHEITAGGLTHAIWNTSEGFDFSPYGGEKLKKKLELVFKTLSIT